MSEPGTVGVPAPSTDGRHGVLTRVSAVVARSAASRAGEEPWIAYATWALLAAIVVVGGFLVWSLVANGDSAQSQSNSARAVANLTALVAKDPADAQAHVRLGQALAADMQTAAAADEFATALRLDPTNVEARTALGLIQMGRHDWKAAESSWLSLVSTLGTQQMASRDQRLADVYYYLGTTLVEEGRYAEAVTRLKASIAMSPDASPVHYMLSVAYERQHLAAQQRAELETVLMFDPKEAQANYDLGMLDLRASQVATAAELFRVAADNAPAGITQPQTQLDALGNADRRLASAFTLRVSDPAAALEQARIAAAIDPKNVRAVQLVAALWDLLGEPARSLNAWRRVLEIAPGDPTATAAIARLTSDGS